MIAAWPLRISGGNSSSGLYAKSKLATINFKSFQRCVWLWLGASGYQHMRFCRRRAQRGRSAAGPDFIVRIGKDGMDVAVQVRHWKSPISKRAVDELRGVLLRDDIPAGMIVASSSCSRAAKVAASEFPGRPIRVVGIDRFAESLVSLGLGDRRFFTMVRQFALGTQSPQVAYRGSRLVTTPSAEVAFEDDPEPELNMVMRVILALALGALIGILVR